MEKWNQSTSWNQTVQPNSQSVVLFFYGKTALEPISYAVKKCVKNVCGKDVYSKEALGEDTRHTWELPIYSAFI